jgi:hypothetical protein
VTTLNLFSKIGFGQFAPSFFGHQVTETTQVTNLFNYATTGRLNYLAAAAAFFLCVKFHTVVKLFVPNSTIF